MAGTKRRHDSISPSTDESQKRDESKKRHYMMRVGDEFEDGRYRVVRQLGKGTFGRVVEMCDTQENRNVAVKVIRSIEKYTEEAKIEASILLSLQRTLPASSSFPITRLLRSFDHMGHHCLVLEPMGPSLYHRLRDTRRQLERSSSGARFTGSFFSLEQIATIAHDCFRAVAHLHQIKLSHTDLKPENILLVESPPHRTASLTRYNVSLIDFGGATWEDEHHSSIVCTRQYRPPEVTLCLGWNHTVDLWSLGCIFSELWTGVLLFSTHDEVEHLALMERILGTLPGRMLDASKMRKAEKTFRHGVLRWPERAMDRQSEDYVRGQPRLRDLIGGEGSEDVERGHKPLPWTKAHSSFYDLLRQLLEFLPDQRLSAADGLSHPFLSPAIDPAAAKPADQLPTDSDRYSTSASRDRPDGARRCSPEAGAASNEIAKEGE